MCLCWGGAVYACAVLRHDCYHGGYAERFVVDYESMIAAFSYINVNISK